MATNFSIYYQRQLVPCSEAGSRGQQDQHHPAEGTQKKGWWVGINPAVTAMPARITDTATEWEQTPAADPPLTHKHFSTEEQCRLTSRRPPRVPHSGDVASHPGDIRRGEPGTPTNAAHTSHQDTRLPGKSHPHSRT